MTRLLFLLLVCPLTGSTYLPDKPLVNITVDKSILNAGMNTEVSIWVEVKMGYHIQANKVDDESLIPTILEVNALKGIMINKQEFPKAKPFQLEGTDSFLNVYDGKFVIKLSISADTEMKAGNYVLNSKLSYQACDSKSCLFPRDVDFSIPIEVKSKD
jgi:hypothetical protein